MKPISWICEVQKDITMFGGGAPSAPALPAIPAPVPQPVPTGLNNSASAAQQAQTIATAQATSGRNSTDLTKGQGASLGGN